VIPGKPEGRAGLASRPEGDKVGLQPREVRELRFPLT